MIKWQKKHGDNSYCGPGAISLVTGESTDDIARRVREFSGRKAIKGMWPMEVVKVLHQLGYEAKYFSICANKPTLAQWCRARSPELKQTMCIVFITGHFICVRGIMAADNEHPTPDFIKKFPYRRCRVKGWITISK